MPSQEEIKMFKNDFVPLLKLCRTLVSSFRDGFLDERNLSVANEYAAKFSKKYRTLRLIIEKGKYELPKPAILLRDEKDFYNIFTVAESLMPDMESVSFSINGKNRTYSVVEFKLRLSEFKKYLLGGPVNFNYAFKCVNRKLELKYRKELEMIQVVDDDFMFDENDPEFRLCMHYAFEEGYNEKISLSKYPLIFIDRTKAEPALFKGSVGGRRMFLAKVLYSPSLPLPDEIRAFSRRAHRFLA